jgi:predicted nucleic acid-binding protein
VRRLFVDTSAWFAYVNRDDPAHERVARALDEFPGILLTSSYVFDETVTLCLARLGHEAAARTGEALLDPDLTDLVRVTARDERDAWKLFLARPDKSYSFTDCTSFVLLRRLGLQDVAALDLDFRREGPALAV